MSEKDKTVAKCGFGSNALVDLGSKIARGKLGSESTTYSTTCRGCQRKFCAGNSGQVGAHSNTQCESKNLFDSNYLTQEL